MRTSKTTEFKIPRVINSEETAICFKHGLSSAVSRIVAGLITEIPANMDGIPMAINNQPFKVTLQILDCSKDREAYGRGLYMAQGISYLVRLKAEPMPVQTVTETTTVLLPEEKYMPTLTEKHTFWKRVKNAIRYIRKGKYEELILTQTTQPAKDSDVLPLSREDEYEMKQQNHETEMWQRTHDGKNIEFLINDDVINKPDPITEQWLDKKKWDVINKNREKYGVASKPIEVRIPKQEQPAVSQENHDDRVDAYRYRMNVLPKAVRISDYALSAGSPLVDLDVLKEEFNKPQQPKPAGETKDNDK